MGQMVTIEDKDGYVVVIDIYELDCQVADQTDGAVHLVRGRGVVALIDQEGQPPGDDLPGVYLKIPPTESTVELDLAALVRPLLLDLLGQVVLKVPPVSLVGSVPTDGSMAECCAEYKFKPVYLTSKAMDVPLGMVAMVGADGQVVVGGDHAAMDPDEPDTPPK